jgi:hypothetical protein
MLVATKSKAKNAIKTRGMLIKTAATRYPLDEREQKCARCAVVRSLDARRNFCCFGTRSFWFFRQEFFDRKRKIKFRFFLVAVARDF